MSYYAEFRDTINIRFDNEELKQLCFDLQIDYENLTGDTKLSKIAALIQYLDRRNRLDELLIRCSQLRSQVDWYQIANVVPNTATLINTIPTSEFQGFPLWWLLNTSIETNGF